MSYTYLQEQVEEYSAESYSDIPQYVLSRLNLTVEKSYYKDSEMESCLNSLSGTMCEHSMENHGNGQVSIVAATAFNILTKEL